MTRLVLIRHGLTAVTGKYLTGQLPGYSLSPEGREQAQAVAERLRRVRLAAIYSSPLERAWETAAAVGSIQRKEVLTHEGLLDTDYGTWSGRTLRSVYRLRAWRVVVHTPSRMQFPGGESLSAVQQRAVAACEQISRRHPRHTVALVTHSDVIKMSVSHYLGQPLDLFDRMAVAPASVTVLDLPAGGSPRVVTINGSGDSLTWT